MSNQFTRRDFLSKSGKLFAMTGLTACSTSRPLYLKKNATHQTRSLNGRIFNLSIGYAGVNFTGKNKYATTVNQTLPGPVLRWKEGETVTLNVTNHLPQSSSIHWHGIILPSNMDGVPGLSFKGIAPGETFTYQFTLQQSGTYWFHSHSNFQEQTGLYGAIVIDPKTPEPIQYDQECVILLSDWSDESPKTIYSNLKKMSHIYNQQERTISDLVDEIEEDGVTATRNSRRMWNQMRMSDRDISDVTGATYSFLMNGVTADAGWQDNFLPGHKIRLRVINASAMTFFDFRIPDLPMQVIAADGQNIQPVIVDEFRIAPAETYDVIIETGNDNIALFAQAIDRSGFAFGKLICDPAKTVLPPEMDAVPVLTNEDMGMGEMDHSSMKSMDHSMSEMDHSGMNHTSAKSEHSQHDHLTLSENHQNLSPAGLGNCETHLSPIAMPSATDYSIDMRSHNPQSGLYDPGIGLRHHRHKLGRRVLNYGDIFNLYPTRDKREPSREIQLRITGNMHRYIWSIDGLIYDQAPPIVLAFNERIRITLINDTMMTHPFHLHGMWSELETGDADYIPRKHTVIVHPGKRISYLVTADAEGRWAYHCHLLYHMLGMMREVRVIKGDSE